MFDNPKIKAIRRMPEGNNIVLIWVMLLTIAGRCNADGNIFLTEKIRYKPETLADELRFSESVVVLALSVLVEYGMIVCRDDAFYIKNWEEYQNVEGMAKVREQTRLRVAKYRENQKALPECNVTSNVKGNADVTQCNATDKNKNKTQNKTQSKKIKANAFEEFAQGDELLLEALKGFEDMRKDIKKPLTDKAKSLLINKLKKYPREEWVEILEQSIMNSWQGIFPLEKQKEVLPF